MREWKSSRSHHLQWCWGYLNEFWFCWAGRRQSVRLLYEEIFHLEVSKQSCTSVKKVYAEICCLIWTFCFFLLLWAPVFFRITENWAGWTRAASQNVTRPGITLSPDFPCYSIPLQMRTISFPLSSNFSGTAFLCMCKLQLSVEHRNTPFTHSTLLSQSLTHAVAVSAAGSLRARTFQKQGVWFIKAWKAAALWPSVSGTGHWHGLCLIT